MRHKLRCCAGKALVIATASVLTCMASGASAAITMTPLWHVDMGTAGYPYLPSQSTVTNTERGIAYNPVTKHVLVVSRATNAGTTPANTMIGIVDAANGANLGSMPTTASMTGGAFNVNKIAVASDGTIYVANLTTATTGGALKVYRYLNETDANPQTVVNIPTTITGTTTGRFGDTMDLRTLPGGTLQMVFGRGTTGSEVEMLQSADGVNWQSKLLTPTGAASLDFSNGIAFGEGNTFWGKQFGSGTNMRRVAFDFDAGTASVTNSYPTSEFDSSIGAIDIATNVDAAGTNMLAGIVLGTANKVQVFQYTTPPDHIFSSQPYAEGVMNLPANANANRSGQVVFSPDGWTLYALQTNNSLYAFSVPEPATAGLLSVGALGLIARRRRD